MWDIYIYIDLYKYMCKNINKHNEKLIPHYVNLETPYDFKLDFQKVDQYRKKVAYPQHRTPQRQWVAKLGIPLYNVLVGTRQIWGIW